MCIRDSDRNCIQHHTISCFSSSIGARRPPASPPYVEEVYLIVGLQVNAKPIDVNPFNLHVVLSTARMDSRVIVSTLLGICRYGPTSRESSGAWTNSLVRRPEGQACDERWTPWPAIQKSAVASGNVLLFRIFPSIGNLFLVLEQLMQVRFLFVVGPFHTCVQISRCCHRVDHNYSAQSLETL